MQCVWTLSPRCDVTEASSGDATTCYSREFARCLRVSLCGVLPQSKVKVSTMFCVVVEDTGWFAAVRNQGNLHKNLYKPTRERVA